MRKSIKEEDYVGKVFNNLTVLCMIRTKKQLIWQCQCKCGKTTNVRHNRLTTTALGCQQCAAVLRNKRKNSRFKTPHYSLKRRTLKAYEQRAKLKGIEFSLTEEAVFTLFNGNCHYCGAAPSASKNNAGNTVDMLFMRNGIDRLDPTNGYTLGNVVSCCKACNLAKHVMSEKDFINWLERAYLHTFSNKKRSSTIPEGSTL